MAPEIARRCVTIADMLGFSICVNTLCFCRTRADDYIVFSEIEAPKRERAQEHTELVTAIEKWEIMNKALMYFSSFEKFWSSREKHARIDIRLRVHLHQLHKYPLCPTPVSDPVCDECYFFLVSVHKYRDSILYNEYHQNPIFCTLYFAFCTETI